MSRGRRWGALAMVAVLASFWSSFGARAAQTARPPVVPYDAPDPELVTTSDGQHLLFTTNISLMGNVVNVPVWRSATLDSWDLVADALPSVGSWARPGLTWAPSVARIGNRWVLHYTATERSSGRQCIGVATSSSADGPYRDTRGGPLVCQRELGGSIDPSVFHAPAGSWWLVWKSDENAIGRAPRLWSQRLASGGLGLTGERKVLLQQDRRWEDGDADVAMSAPWRRAIEQPEMVHSSGRYWLFYSGNWWSSSRYGVGYAVCAGPGGPCRKQTVDRPWLGAADGLSGPGALSVSSTPGRRRVAAFHSWTGAVGYASGGQRRAHVEPIDIGPDAVRLRADRPRIDAMPDQSAIGGDRVPISGDFDGDLRDDVLFYGPGAQHDVLWMSTGPAFTEGIAVDVDGDYRPVSGDFNGDGRDDILWYARGAATDWLWYGRADGFSAVRVVAGGSYRPFTGDFNGDRVDDVFWYGPGDAGDGLWLGRAGGGFQWVGQRVTGNYRPAVGDFDGDLRDDIIWYAAGGTSDPIWYGGLGLDWRRTSTSVRGRYVPVVGDFAADGRDDVLWYAPGGAGDTLWNFAPTGRIDSTPNVDRWFRAAAGNFSGDLADDIVWYGTGDEVDELWIGGVLSRRPNEAPLIAP